MGATLHFTVRHDGEAVIGAKVCITADMPGMQHPGVNKVAEEALGGRYDAGLKFGMAGAWAASVTIAEPRKPAVSVPARFQVS